MKKPILMCLYLLVMVSVSVSSWAQSSQAIPPSADATTHEIVNTISNESLEPEMNSEQQTGVEKDQANKEPDTQDILAGHDLSPWEMYQGADMVVKSVIIGLLIASIATWSILIFKSLQLYAAKRQAKTLLSELIERERFTPMSQTSSKHQVSAHLLVAACELELNLSAKGTSSDDGIKERTTARLERVQAGLLSHMNRGTGILATIGSVAPFIGLFGTVWGIMNSFIGIAKTQTTNLSVVAPGIAEALLATAIGLVAAIPAVVIYNYFSRAIGQYRSLLVDIMTSLMVLISRDLDRQSCQALQQVETTSPSTMMMAQGAN